MMNFIQEYWLEAFFGVVTTATALLVKRLGIKLSEQESIKLGVQALLRDRIIQSYNHYMDKGFCPIYARENINALAKEYHNLGGNGIIDNILEKLYALPTEESNE